MKLLLLVVLLLLPVRSITQVIEPLIAIAIWGEGSADSLTITNAPCVGKVGEVVEKMLPGYQKLARAAVLVYKNKTYASCWLYDGTHVFSIDETGDPLQKIPKDSFMLPEEAARYRELMKMDTDRRNGVAPKQST